MVEYVHFFWVRIHGITEVEIIICVVYPFNYIDLVKTHGMCQNRNILPFKKHINQWFFPDISADCDRSTLSFTLI